MSKNKSAFNWTFCQLLTEKPNCMKKMQNKPETHAATWWHKMAIDLPYWKTD
jgi:hypothetical protein